MDAITCNAHALSHLVPPLCTARSPGPSAECSVPTHTFLPPPPPAAHVVPLGTSPRASGLRAHFAEHGAEQAAGMAKAIKSHEKSFKKIDFIESISDAEIRVMKATCQYNIGMVAAHQGGEPSP